MSRTASVSVSDAVAAYLDHLAVERGLATNTVRSYRRDLTRYAEFLTGRGVADPAGVGEADISAFAVALREGDADKPPLAAASASRALVAVRGFHRFAHAEHWAPDDPSTEIRPPAPPRRLPKAIALTEVERILHAADRDHPSGDPALALRDRALLELLYGTGARISEAVGLDVDDVDTEAGSALLAGKGGKERVVPVGSYAIGALEAYRIRGRPVLAERRRVGRVGGQHALFLNHRGGRLSRQSAWAVLRGAADRAGVRIDVSPHTLRHSFATHLLDGGADVRVVQELLGHASVTTTQLYTLVTVEQLKEIYVAAHPRARTRSTPQSR